MGRIRTVEVQELGAHAGRVSTKQEFVLARDPTAPDNYVFITHLALSIHE